MTTFTVVGIYQDNKQCYATVIEADTPEDAIAEAREEIREDSGEQLLVAAVFTGDCRVADVLTYATDGPGFGATGA